MDHKEKCAALDAQLRLLRDPSAWNKATTHIPDGMRDVIDLYCAEYDVSLGVAIYRLASIGAVHWLADNDGCR